MTAAVLAFTLGCTKGAPPKASAEQLRAYDVLLSATVVDSAHVGAIGNLSYPARAFRILLEAVDAEARFATLAEKAALGGRLIALCGLKLKAPDRYATALIGARQFGGEVGGIQGCLLGMTRPVADVLSQIDQGTFCAEYAGTDEPDAIREQYRAEGLSPR